MAKKLHERWTEAAEKAADAPKDAAAAHALTTKLAQKAVDEIDELIELQGEYQDRLDRLPENLKEGKDGFNAERVSFIDMKGARELIVGLTNTDLQRASELVDDAKNAVLPWKLYD
jgi:hypothetical protein